MDRVIPESLYIHGSGTYCTVHQHTQQASKLLTGGMSVGHISFAREGVFWLVIASDHRVYLLYIYLWSP